MMEPRELKFEKEREDVRDFVGMFKPLEIGRVGGFEKRTGKWRLFITNYNGLHDLRELNNYKREGTTDTYFLLRVRSTGGFSFHHDHSVTNGSHFSLFFCIGH